MNGNDAAGHFAVSRAWLRCPRCEEPLSMIQNMSGAVRFLSHDLRDQTLERVTMPVVGSQRAKIWVLDGHPKPPDRTAPPRSYSCSTRIDRRRRWSQTRVFPPPRLDAGLFVRRQHAIGVAERPALPDTEKSYRSRMRPAFSAKLRVSREDPAAMAPGPDRSSDSHRQIVVSPIARPPAGPAESPRPSDRP